MDLLQRIQRWYTINCDGDWEHENIISITTVDNPGWAVTIDLEDTCLRHAVLPYFLTERTPTDWVEFHAENSIFKGNGGPNNLSEILAYFLDTFLPQHIAPETTYKLYLPMHLYEGQLWLQSEAKFINESTLEIVSITNSESPNSYEWNLAAETDLLKTIEASLSTLQIDFKVGDLVNPALYQAPDNQLRTFLVATSKQL